MATVFVVDGDIPLSEQQDRLNFAQNLSISHVKSYQEAGAHPNDPIKHPNVVTLESLPIGGVVKPIVLKKATDPKPDGKQEVFTEDVFVSGVITKVSGYR